MTCRQRNRIKQGVNADGRLRVQDGNGPSDPSRGSARGNESGPPSIVFSGDRYAPPAARDLPQRDDSCCSAATTAGGFSPCTSQHVIRGNTRTKIELGDFLARGKAGPEHQALVSLIGSLLDKE